MKHDSNSSALLSVVCASVIVGLGCGSNAPTKQLVDARRVYGEAASGEAARLTPDKLLGARQALNRAEVEHEDDPGSDQEAHLAYLALRKSAMAIASGKIAAAEESKRESESNYRSDLKEQATESRTQLDRTETELASVQRQSADAERRAAAAIASLTEVAKVIEENRGTVITMPGSVLFPSGGQNLSASARQALDKVAMALTAQPEGANIVVEGHTDGRGAEDRNRQLSQQRAEAVRDYLVTRGLNASRIEAVGKGEASPIADNESAEGRATNRRVQIVVGREGATTAEEGTSPQGTQGMSPQSTSPQGTSPHH